MVRCVALVVLIAPLALLRGEDLQPDGDGSFVSTPAADPPPTLAGAVRVPVDLAAWDLPAAWAVRSAVVRDGEGCRPCLRFITTYRANGYQPTLKFVYPADVAKVVFSGRMRVQDVVPGNEGWQKARAQLRFLDRDGDQVGGWPATTNLDGTHEWTAFRQEHVCPPGTRVADMWLGMACATGTVWYDDLQIAAFDGEGKALLPIRNPTGIRNDTSTWWTFAPGDEDATRPLVIDFGPWMPAPAGRFGRVVARDGHLAFAHGGRARFWGSGAGAWCPDTVRASDDIVRNLVRDGINLVRFHGMDATDRSKSIFDPASPATDRLDPVKLDRMDRHVANLRQHGIYIDLNLLTKRRFTTADGVRDADRLPEGGKAAALFDRRLIELQKEYARSLLGHVNPYTGLAYKDDPAVVLVEIVNESSLFTLGAFGGLPPFYEDELDQLFSAWCSRTGVARPERPIAALLSLDPIPADVVRFCDDATAAYYRQMKAFLKQDLGVQSLIIGTSFASRAGEKRVQADLDVIDAHAYHDHPSGGWRPTDVFTDRPMVRSSDNIVSQLAHERVAGLPFVVSEWNCVWSNRWITEGPLLMASYAGFEDWDGLMAFTVSGDGWQPRMDSCWRNDDKPHVMAASAAAALAFYRGDVEPGPLRLVPLGRIDPGARIGAYVGARGRGAEQALLTERCALGVQDAPEPAAATARADGDLASSDGQIRWDVRKGLFILDTPRTQAVLGFTDAAAVATRDARVTISNPFAQVIVSALDDQPIATTHRLLITATAQAENSGQTYRLFFKGLRSLGQAPIRLEPVRAEVTFRRPGSAAPVVRALDWYGRRTTRTMPVAASPEGGWVVSLGDEPAAWFEVVWP